MREQMKRSYTGPYGDILVRAHRKNQAVAIKKKKAAKRRYLRKSIHFLIILGVVICFLLFGTANIANAGTKDSVRYKYYTSIRISKGSSLWDIAQEYMTEEYKSVQEYIKEVKAMNHLSSDLIYEGSYLCIPYYSSEKK